MYPVRCFTCGKVLGNLWETWFVLTEGRCITDAYTRYKAVELCKPVMKKNLSDKEKAYNEKVKKKNQKILKNAKYEVVPVDKAKTIKRIFDHYGVTEPISKPHAADTLGLKRQCCRTVMFSTVVYDDVC